MRSTSRGGVSAGSRGRATRFVRGCPAQARRRSRLAPVRPSVELLHRPSAEVAPPSRYAESRTAGVAPGGPYGAPAPARVAPRPALARTGTRCVGRRCVGCRPARSREARLPTVAGGCTDGGGAGRAHAGGGGRSSVSGTVGVRGAEHRGEDRGLVDAALRGGAHDAGQHLLGVGAVAGAVAAADLAGDDGGSDGLFSAPDGGVDRRVGAGTATRPGIRWRCERRSAGRRRSAPGHRRGELGFESAAAVREAVLAHDAGVAAVEEVEAGLEDRLDADRVPLQQQLVDGLLGEVLGVVPVRLAARDAEDPLADQVFERVPNLLRRTRVDQTPGEPLDEVVHPLGGLSSTAPPSELACSRSKVATTGLLPRCGTEHPLTFPRVVLDAPVQGSR